MILYINACVRDGSRTRVLAERLLAKLADPEQILAEVERRIQ